MNSRSPYETIHSHFSSWAFLPKEPVVALVSLLTFGPSGSHWPIVTRLSWKTTESGNACMARNPFVSFADAPGQPWRTALASRLQGGPDDKDEEQQDEAEPPLPAHLVSTGHST